MLLVNFHSSLDKKLKGELLSSHRFSAALAALLWLHSKPIAGKICLKTRKKGTSIQPDNFRELTVRSYWVPAKMGKGSWERNEWPEVKMEQDCEDLGTVGVALHPGDTAWMLNPVATPVTPVEYWVWERYMKGDGDGRMERAASRKCPFYLAN